MAFEQYLIDLIRTLLCKQAPLPCMSKMNSKASDAFEFIIFLKTLHVH